METEITVNGKPVKKMSVHITGVDEEYIWCDFETITGEKFRTLYSKGHIRTVLKSL